MRGEARRGALRRCQNRYNAIAAARSAAGRAKGTDAVTLRLWQDESMLGVKHSSVIVKYCFSEAVRYFRM